MFAATSVCNHRESQQHPEHRSLGELIAAASNVASGTIGIAAGAGAGGGAGAGAGGAAAGGVVVSDVYEKTLSDPRLRQHVMLLIQRTTMSFVYDETDPRSSCLALWMERYSQVRIIFIVCLFICLFFYFYVHVADLF